MIELTLMDQNFEVRGFIDGFSSLIWTRRYYEIGEFELHTKLKDFTLLKTCQYIWSQQFSEVGIIEEYGYDKDKKEAWCKGRFLEALLLDRTADDTPPNATWGLPEILAQKLVTHFAISPADSARKIAGLHLGMCIASENPISYEPRGRFVWEACSEMLKPIERAMRIRYEYLEDRLYFDVWQGLDRTENQAENSLAIFSEEYENVQAAAYSTSLREFKNCAYVAGEGEGAARVIVLVDQSNGGQRREVWIDARDLQKEEQTDAQYHEALRQRGVGKLAEYGTNETIDAVLSSSGALRYKLDYDLGDLCTYEDVLVGLAVNQRITEITEVFENGAHLITPIFGNENKTILQKIRRDFA